jgi:hypothetical protein
MDGEYYLCGIKNINTMDLNVDTFDKLLSLLMDGVADPEYIKYGINRSYDAGVISDKQRDLLFNCLYGLLRRVEVNGQYDLVKEYLDEVFVRQCEHGRWNIQMMQEDDLPF